MGVQLYNLVSDEVYNDTLYVYEDIYNLTLHAYSVLDDSTADDNTSWHKGIFTLRFVFFFTDRVYEGLMHI